jgi:adenylylsulfate kinase-like enzyme
MKSRKTTRSGWVIWFVGLPGAGKSTYAQAVYRALENRGEDVRYLSMDERRQAYVDGSRYTGQERKQVYRLFVEEAAEIAGQGINVVMDATAPELFMREYARELIERFAEIYVRCSFETAMRRESDRPRGLVMASLYEKAIERKQSGKYFRGLGEVVGVDVPFEENPDAECVIDSEKMNLEQGRDRVLAFLSAWLAPETSKEG